MFGLFGTTDSKHLRRIWTATKFAGNSSAADDKANSWNFLFEKCGINFNEEPLNPRKLEPLAEAAIKFDQKNPRNSGILVTSEFWMELNFRSASLSDGQRNQMINHFADYLQKRGISTHSAPSSNAQTTNNSAFNRAMAYYYFQPGVTVTDHQKGIGNIVTDDSADFLENQLNGALQRGNLNAIKDMVLDDWSKGYIAGVSFAASKAHDATAHFERQDSAAMLFTISAFDFCFKGNLGTEVSRSAFEDFAEKHLSEDDNIRDGFSVGYLELTEWLEAGREFDDKKLSLLERHTPVRFKFITNLGIQLQLEMLKAKLSSRDENIAAKLANDSWCLGYIIGVSKKAFDYARMNEHGEVFDRSYIQSVFRFSFGEELLEKVLPLYDRLVEAGDLTMNEGMNIGGQDYSVWTEGHMGSMGLLSLPDHAAKFYGPAS